MGATDSETTGNIVTDIMRDEFLRHRLNGTRGRVRSTGHSVIGRAERSRPLPLSYGQQQMWFLDQLEPGGTEYLVPLSFRLRGRLDAATLAGAWDELVARHEILRTRHVLADGQPVQIVDAPVQSGLALMDLADLVEAERERRAAEITEQEAACAFDLAREWPVRAKLLRLADDDHVLVIVFHHIACDAWSTGVLSAELGVLYRAFTNGLPSPLTPLPVQYADFAAWQREQLPGEVLDRQLEYWRTTLDGITPLELPTDRARPAVRGYAGAEIPFDLPAEFAGRVRDIANRYDLTPFVVLLTAFQALLARYTGRRDVPVGTVVSGRTRPELQNLIGYGVNTLVLRTRWEGDVSFAELLGQVRGVVLDAFDHQAAPFIQVVDEVQPVRDLSRTPLYQVVFTLHETGGGGFDAPGVTSEPYLSDGGIARCDLELQVREAPDGSFAGRMMYATDLFHPETVERMVRHFVRVLDRALASPKSPLSRLEIFDDDEVALLVGRSQAAPGSGTAQSARESFEEQVARTPEATAVITASARTTFAQLNERADRIAGRLRSLGVGPESVVGVLLNRDVDLIAAFLAVWKAGGAYLPLDPTHPAERWGYMLADAGAGWVLTEAFCAEEAARVFSGERVVLGARTDEFAALAAEAPTGPQDLDTLAYVIYTSGSTGRPKGVQITHRNLATHLRWVLAEYIRNDLGGAPLFSTVSSDVVVPTLFGPLLAGQPVHLFPQDMDLAELGARLVESAPFSFIKLTPGHLEMLSQQMDATVANGLAATVVTGGDVLLGRTAERWQELLGTGRVINEYGPTEITVGNSVFFAEGPQSREVVPIGRPIPDTSMYVMDEELNLVPPGVVGEVYVGGAGVARGYANRPALTAERFVPDPYGAAGERLYRTGDLGRVLLDGNVDFVGRSDEQVKIRGYRVEPGEIEGVLAGHPRVAEARVVLHRDGQQGRLVAYLVPVRGHDATETVELQGWLGDRLPEYMIPTAFLWLDRIPLTTNGKLDTAALPAPRLPSAADSGHVAPRTEMEARVAAVWARVLEVGQVGVEDSFFDLGGDSIRAVALVGALRAEGLDVSVRDVFACRSVAGLCESMSGRPKLADEPVGVRPFALISEEERRRLPAGVADAYPLSQSQLGMLIEMLADDQNSYHNVTSFRILDDRPFSLAAWQETVRIVVARHEALRTSLHLTGYSVPMQLVHASAELPFGMDDISGADAETVERVLREFSERERADLFALGTPSLMRMFAHVTGDGGYWLSVTECHPILEGWGHHSLLMEMLDCYGLIRDGGRPEPYDPPGVRFADFIAGELVALESDEDRGYWRGITDAYVPCPAPSGWGDPSLPVGTRYLVERVPWHDLEDGLRALATEADTSLKSVLVAAYVKVMSQLTEEPAFHVGLVCDARPEMLGADQVYGMYLNTLPFAADRDARTWRDLVRQVFDREVELWPHRRFPLAEIQRSARGRQRLVNVYFNYQDFRQVDIGVVDVAGTDDSPTEFPLTMSSRAGHVWVTADPRVVSARNATRILAMFRAVLESMASGGHGDARATYLPPGEREWLSSNTRERQPVEVRVVERVEWFAKITPEAVALVADDGTLTYRELNARANQMASYLRGRGVGPDVVVGVRAERSAELIVTLVAVLKAGGAYLPLDWGLPPERLQYMITNAGARLVASRGPEGGLPALDGVGVVPLDEPDRWADEPAGDLPRVTDGTHLAYVIYTSGSTGHPKGVMVTHRGMGNHLLSKVEDLGLTCIDTVVQNAPMGFDISVWQMLASLVTGGRVRVVGRQGALDPRTLFALVADERVSVLEVVPSLLRAALDGWDTGMPLPDVGSLRWLVVTGEALPPELCERWLTRFPHVPMVNAYGPTECSDDVTHAVIASADELGGERVPIGRPIRNTVLHVLGEWLEPVPAGVLGELYAGGVGVARGYVGHPGLTAERFVPDPLGPAGARLYRTGDLVRLLPGGSLEFLGRVDDQVKIRGHRIELSEIEAAMTRSPLVQQAAAVVREVQGGTLLVGYVVPANEGTAEPGALRAELARILPDYMVPSAYVSVDRIPLTANGKIDRRSLPAPDPDAFGRRAPMAPRTALEKRVAAAWLSALPVDRVGVEDEFFDLGGDSIRAVAVVGTLRAQGLDLHVRDLFEHLTVARLCAAVAERPVLDGTGAPVPAGWNG